MKKLNKIASLILTIVLTITSLPIYNIMTFATNSGNYSYIVLDDGTIRLTSYNGSETEVVIPNEIDGYKVTDLSGTFQDNDIITKVEIPNTVTGIGTSTFYHCDKLSNIVIPDSVTYIGAYAFYRCPLVNVTLGKGITYIGNNAFELCSFIENLYYTGTIKDWLKISFYNEKANPMYYATNEYFDGMLLDEIIVPDSMTTINNYSFYYCNATTVIISDSITQIGNKAFNYCENLVNLTLGKGVKNIGDIAFGNCSNLVNMYYTGTADDWANIVFGSSSDYIGYYANPAYYSKNEFFNEELVTNIILSSDVERINDSAFAGFNNMESILIREGVTCIGKDAFYDCFYLSSITIPKSVSVICDGAFTYVANGLENRYEDIYYVGTCEEWNDISIGSANMYATLHYEVSDIDEHWGDGTTTTEVNCGEQCETTYTCPCGHTRTKVVKKEHDFDEWMVTTYATCTEKGEEKRICYCGEVETREIEATGHNYEEFIVVPSCTTRGYITYICHCGDTYIDNYVEATGHSFGDWIVTTAPTCMAKGILTHICHCGETETRIIAPLGHDYKVTTIKPTCIEGGYDLHTCSVCGDFYRDNETTAIGHTFSDWIITKPATTTEKGEETCTCVCGETETREIPMLEAQIMLGDVNGDGKLSALDARWALQYSADNRTLTATQISVCDVNGDGKVTAVDARWILQASAGNRKL